jgi:hypothetical protein
MQKEEKEKLRKNSNKISNFFLYFSHQIKIKINLVIKILLKNLKKMPVLKGNACNNDNDLL